MEKRRNSHLRYLPGRMSKRIYLQRKDLHSENICRWSAWTEYERLCITDFLHTSSFLPDLQHRGTGQLAQRIVLQLAYRWTDGSDGQCHQQRIYVRMGSWRQRRRIYPRRYCRMSECRKRSRTDWFRYGTLAGFEQSRQAQGTDQQTASWNWSDSGNASGSIRQLGNYRWPRNAYLRYR